MTAKLIHIITILAIGSSLAFVNPDGHLNDLEKYRLKGKVKSIMETKYAIPDKSGKSDVNKVLYQKLISFDMNGYVEEIILYNNSAVFLDAKFTSRGDGVQLGMKEYLPDGSENLQVEYILDEKDNRSEASYSWVEDRIIGELCEMYDYYYEILQNELFNLVKYKYDYRGYCTQEDYLKADGTLSFRLASKYDFKGNKLESAYFRGNEMLSWVTKYTYDRYDNLVESRVFKSNRIAVLSKYKHQFDDTGNWVSRKETREVYVNILTAGLNTSDMLTERVIEYY